MYIQRHNISLYVCMKEPTTRHPLLYTSYNIETEIYIQWELRRIHLNYCMYVLFWLNMRVIFRDKTNNLIDQLMCSLLFYCEHYFENFETLQRLQGDIQTNIFTTLYIKKKDIKYISQNLILLIYSQVPISNGI